jgi:hypothetical protein
MLGAEDHLAASDERDKRHRYLHRRQLVQVERLARQVVQPLDGKSGFLTDLAHRGLFGSLARIEAAVHDLPGASAPRPGSTAQHEDAQSTRVMPDDEDVDDADDEIGHAAIGSGANRRQAFRRSALSLALNARGRKGFVIKSFAPFSKTLTSLSSSPFAVSTSTGSSAVPGRARRWVSTW